MKKMMKSYSLVFFSFFCCALSKKLTDNEIRHNFNDVKTGMKVLLNELVAVMDVNEKLSNDLGKTSDAFGKLRNQNDNLVRTLKTVQNVIQTLKNNIIQFNDQLRSNITREQNKKKRELKKYISDKYAIFSWMVDKLEGQHKKQKMIIEEFKSESFEQKNKLLNLEEKIQVIQNQLKRCEKTIKKHKRTIFLKAKKSTSVSNTLTLISTPRPRIITHGKLVGKKRMNIPSLNSRKRQSYFEKKRDRKVR